jgi:hypothetical protein
MGGSSLQKLYIDRMKEAVNNEAGQSRGKGVPLGEAVFLKEKIKGAVHFPKIAAGRGGVHEIEVVQQSMKLWAGFEDILTIVARHLIPAIDQMDEETSLSGRFAISNRVGDEGIILAMG